MRRRDFVTLLGGASESTKNPSVRAGIDEYHSEASVLLPTSAVEQQAPGPWGLSREAPAMPVPSEPFATVYEDRNRLGVIVARTGRGGFEAYAADNHSLGLFPSPREAPLGRANDRRGEARTAPPGSFLRGRQVTGILFMGTCETVARA